MNTYLFVRRYLHLNPEKNSFAVIRDKLYEEVGENYEEGLERLVQNINAEEGIEGLLSNNGFPSYLDTPLAQALYLSKYLLFTHLSNREEQGRSLPVLESEGLLCSGFYANQDLKLPRSLVTSRIHVQGVEMDYIFYPEGGKYKGELDCCFYYQGIHYTSDNPSPKWFFPMEKISIQEECQGESQKGSGEEPYLFMGKLLCFFQSHRTKNLEIPRFIVKLFRTEDAVYLLYSHFYDKEGKAQLPRTLLRSSSTRKIYRRLQHQFESHYPAGDNDNVRDITRFLQELIAVLNIK